MEKIIEGGYSYIKDVEKKFKTFAPVTAVGLLLTAIAFYMNCTSDESLWEIAEIILPVGLIILIPGGIYFTIVAIAYVYTKTTKIVVTDKRVYGTAIAKQVDLPLDSISAVSTTRFFKGIAVATSSGRIVFYGIDNRDAVYNAINRLLIDRQNKPATVIAQATPTTQEASGADELKKFKELLDMGAITQEEFDAKKKQLLGL